MDATVPITFFILLLALSEAGSRPQPHRSLESLERDIAESHRREHITLDDDIRALLAVRLGTDWSR